jgi:hypothetical protein
MFGYIREPFLKCYFSSHLENNSDNGLKEYTKKMYNTEENPLNLASSLIKNISKIHCFQLTSELQKAQSHPLQNIEDVLLSVDF